MGPSLVPSSMNELVGKVVGVTGGNGFIGSALVRKLSVRNRVVALDKRASVTDYAALVDFIKGKDVIIHLAAVNRGPEDKMLSVNVRGTYNVLKAACEYSRGARVILASSFQVYKPVAEQVPLNEAHSLEPVTFYGATKLAAEAIARYFAYAGLNVTILRISNVYGPGCRPFYNSVVATFSYLAVKGEPLPLTGDLSDARDFIYVDDVVRAIEIVAASMTREPVYNVCSGRLITLQKLIETISQAVGGSHSTWFRNSAQSSKDGLYLRGDGSRLREELGFAPEVTFEDGIRRTIDYWRQVLG